MNQEHTIEDKKRMRFETVVDIVYLLGLACLYVTSLVMPIIGIVIAIILKTGSLTERTKRVGNVCLILAFIGLGIFVLLIIIGIVIAAIASGYYY
ncbi:hypothetical protein JXM67_12750 [candidate division WOR-3 bacterium]|nr:hypothetical protein [candidate division WOR-3 bacterium]